MKHGRWMLVLLAALLLAGVLGLQAQAADFNEDRISELVIGIPGEDYIADVTVNDAGAFDVLYGQTLSGLDDAGEQFLHQAVASVAGNPEDGDELGAALAVGDFDNDGHWDLAVGVPGEVVSAQDEAGAVHIFYGNGSTVAVDRDVLIHQDTVDVGGAPEPGDHFGSDLEVGNFNHDAYDDLAVSVVDEAIGAEASAGMVQVLFGSASGLTGTGSLMFYQGNNGLEDLAKADDKFGAELAVADFNGDGHDDLVVAATGEDIGIPGEPGFLFDTGVVQVIYGAHMNPVVGDLFLYEDSPTFGLCDVSTSSQFFGAGLATGDFDDDLFPDLAIGSNHNDGWYYNGSIHIIFGMIDGLTDSGDQCWYDTSMGLSLVENEFLGQELASCDFNGDGHDDLAIGAPRTDYGSIDDYGSLVVVYGGGSGIVPSTAVLFEQGLNGLADTREDYDAFGSVLVGGNFNGDAYCDLAVGVPSESVGEPDAGNAGIVQVLFGSATGISTKGNQVWYQGHNGLWGAPAVNDRFGEALAAWPFYNQLIFLPLLRH